MNNHDFQVPVVEDSGSNDIYHRLITMLTNITIRMDRKIDQLENKLNEKSLQVSKSEQEKAIKEQKMLTEITELEKDLEKLEELRIECVTENTSLKQELDEVTRRLSELENKKAGFHSFE